jgi:predicted TPR repeat methyltransferase
MLERAKLNNPEASFELLDTRNILSLQKKFNGIVCGFGLPYLNKEEAIQFINDAARCLEDGGVLYLSTMMDSYEKSGYKTGSSGEAIFIYYHEESYLMEAIEASGMRMLHSIEKAFPESDGSITTDLILIAEKI